MDQQNASFLASDARELNAAEPPAIDMVLVGTPVMGWRNASAEWGTSWQVYTTSAIIVNAILILWTLSNLIYICTRRGRSLVSRKYFLTLNILVLIFAVAKELFYAIDPMSIKGVMPTMAGNLLYNTSFPTLTVGFCMLYVALRQCSIPNRHLLPLILKTRCMVIFTLACFSISYITDVLVGHFHSMQLMMLICQLFYILWGVIFFCLYSVLVYRYRVAVRKTKKKMEKSCYRRGHCRRGFNKRNLKELPGCMKISCLTAVCFLMLALLTVFMVLMEIGVLRNSSLLTAMCKKYRQLWPFYSFHVLFVCVEHLMALTLALAGTQPLKWLRLSPILLAENPTPSANNAAKPSDTVPNVYTIENDDLETSFTDATSQQTGSSAATSCLSDSQQWQYGDGGSGSSSLQILSIAHIQPHNVT